jgi:Ca2+-binding RTX toxin-like protein
VTYSFSDLGVAGFRVGGDGNDVLLGSISNDVMTGEAGNDTMSGRGGADSIYGQSGNDVLKGGAGADTLYGGANNDDLRGDAGVDLLYGQDGNDILLAESSGDTLSGGAGSDIYKVNAPAGSTVYIREWDNVAASGLDTLEITAVGADPLKTRFSVVGTELIVEVRNTSNQVLSTVRIQNDGNLATVETLRINYSGPLSQTYQLQQQMDFANAGVTLGIPSDPAVPDYADNITTSGRLTINSSVSSAIDSPGDTDWYQVILIAGRSYRFDMKGAPTGSGTLPDPFIRLRDAAGTKLVWDDDTGTGNDASLGYTATATGTYYISAGSSVLAQHGSYLLSAVQTSVTPPVANTAPMIAGGSQVLTAGSTLAASALFQATDGEGNAIVAYTITNASGSGYFQLGGVRQPEGGSFTVTAGQFVGLQYVVGAAGTTDTFVVRASDGSLEGPNHSISVASTAPAPTNPVSYKAQDDVYTTTSGSSIVLPVLANDDSNLVQITDLHGEDARYVAIQHGSQNTITVSPPSHFVGDFRFSYTAIDGKGSVAYANVTVNVTAPLQVNHIPVAPDLHQTISTGQQTIVDLLLFSSDPDADDAGQLAIQGYSTPGHGALTRTGNLLTYLPDSGFVGDDTFTYVIGDPHGAQATGVVKVTVAQALAAFDDTAATGVGATVTFNVLQNDKYASNSLFFLQGPDFLGTSPAHGTVSLSQSGLATYTPDAGYSGVDTFTYRATYLGTGAYSTGNVTIMVGNTGQQGGAGPDILNGTDASNALFGNGGDDVVWGGAGNDVLDGGEGFDTISFVGAPAGISVNLELPYADGTGAINWADPYFWTHDGLGGRDSVRNMEAVLGSEFSDLIEGNPAANSLFGSGGNDSISGGGGNDTAYGGEGDDLLQSGVNLGVAGKYDFIGGGGNDYLVGNTGVDSLDGGPGNDSIDGWGGIDNLVGREGNDRLRGTGTLDGGDGDDVLGVSNVLSGSVVASRLVGGNGNDQLSGNSGNDTLEGGSDNDTLGGGIGDDFMDGGIGFDLVDLRGEPAGVNVDLATGFAQTTRGIKTLVSIEAIYGSWNASDRILGSDAPEGLYGDFGDDTLIGSGGSDSLDGGTGNDWIQGGDGADSLTGGAGTDRFVYSSMADRGDVISDFVAGQGGDVIDIASVVAGSGYSGATPAAAGYLRLVVAGSDTQVQFDLDGSLGNFVFETLATLRGVSPSTLTSANFSAGVDASTLLDGIPVTFQIGFSGAGQKPGSEDAAVAEGDTGSTSIVLQIVRSGNTASSVTAALTFETGHGLDHSDFIDGLPADRTLVFAPGQTTYSIALSVVGDALLEADEKLSVTVSSPTVPDPTSANFWILSNENLIEGDGSVLGTDLDDVIQTRGAADFVLAGTGNDIISTGAGADYVDAGDGDDVIDAGEGRDTIDGGAGDDSLVGGDGADVFKFAASGNGVDTISGFSGGDQIIVGARLAALPAVAAGGVVNGTRVHVGSSGGSTSMFIDADGIAGADIEIQLVGAHPYYAFEITDNDDGTTGIALATAQNLTGDSGGNALTGRALNDMISGMAGNDTLSGGLGDDTLDGGADNDTASYAGVTGGVTVLLWNNQATGADGADTLLSIENLIGTAFNDRLDGTNSANDLYGSDGADSLYGYAGADILAGGQGNDLIDGGADTDTASFATATGAVSVFLWSGQATGADGSDVLFNIDSVVGSAFGDRLDGTNIANRLEGVNGMDSLYGYGGNDTLIGGAGNDVLDGGADTDTASFAGASGAVTAYLWGSQAAGADGTDTLASIENLIGSAFNDRLDGTNSANSLEGGAGADSLYSYGGNDTLTGGAGNDLLDGGADTDTASYAGATGSVTVYLWGSQATGAGGTDTLGSIENLIGSGFNDRLDGTNTANSLDGGAGADSVYGYGGNDTLTGGAGNDVLDGGADTDTVSYAGATGSITAYLWNGQVTGDGTDTLVGIETLIGSGFNDRLDGTNTANSLDGGAGADSLYGYGGNDTLTGGIGNDVLDGGADTDTASYAGATGAVTAYLWNSQATGAGGTDTLTNIENLIGSAFNDRLDGTNSANSVEGGTGADSLYGYGGADTLTGGAGNDVLDGGADADAFMFDAGSGVDLVYNFAIAQGDKINLKSGLNGSGITSAAQALASTTDVGGHATVNLGSGHTITLVGVTTAGLSAADFVIF